MTPAERGPAIRRLLMLTAGGIDTDDSLHTVHDLLRTFDDLDAATDLACSIAAQTVTVVNTLPPDVLGDEVADLYPGTGVMSRVVAARGVAVEGQLDLFGLDLDEAIA